MKQMVLRFSMLTLLLSAFCASMLSAQEIQEIAVEAAYGKQSFVSLSAGSEQQADNASWGRTYFVSVRARI